jgi:arylsulfatase A-like enzyme
MAPPEVGGMETQPVRRVSGPADISKFGRLTAMPALPDGLDTGRFNILLITVEAMRHDQTSLADPHLETTPRLADLVERGATTYSRAYSPSSGTLLSMASVHTMTFPSSASVTVWSKSWHGNLDPKVPTVAEELHKAGIHTFWVSHDHRYAFSRCMKGFDRGFEDISFVHANEKSRDTDGRIADQVVARMDSLRQRRFFGWVFFASPHAGYVAHYPELPGGSPLELYRQEIRYADEQIGRIVTALEQSGLMDRTIIVVGGDHGEEFGEHGGTRHKATVYDESVHVPLVIYVPGLGKRIEARPTSLAYVLPWLLVELGLSDVARQRIIGDFMPMMDATRGGVVIELIGKERTRSSLVFPSHKVNFNFRSNREEVFDLGADPGEHRNLLKHSVAGSYLAAMRQYREIRALKQNVVFDSTRRCDNTEERAGD